MNIPNISTVAANIRDFRADQIERDRAKLAAFAVDVAEWTAEASNHATADAMHAASCIDRMQNVTEADAAMIAAALFRCVVRTQNLRTIDGVADGLSDVVGDLVGTLRGDR